MYVVAAPPVPKREEDEPGYHLHDTFYLRMSLGGGYASSRVESERSSVADVRLAGGGACLDLLMGGTPTPGLVIGGGVFVEGGDKPRVESGGKSQDLDGSASLSLIGPFVDGFFDPSGGFHVGGAIGLTSLEVKPDDKADFDEEPFKGGGVLVLTGYDAWISPNWSLGGYARFLGAIGKRELDVGSTKVEEKATSWAFSVLFSALYH